MLVGPRAPDGGTPGNRGAGSGVDRSTRPRRALAIDAARAPAVAGSELSWLERSGAEQSFQPGRAVRDGAAHPIEVSLDGVL